MGSMLVTSMDTEKQKSTDDCHRGGTHNQKALRKAPGILEKEC